MQSHSNSTGGGRRRQWLNAWLTALLVILVLVQGNRLARRHLNVVRDITEDQLFLPSDVGLRMLGELEDTLQVKAFFTGDVKAGSIQIAKRRLIDQLEEFASASGGRMQITYEDPNASTSARREAEGLGIRAEPYRVQQGVSQVAQDIWLGLVLRYRGKESVLKWVLPQLMESKFLLALRKVTREVLPTVGIITGDGRNLDPRFVQLRADLRGQYQIHEVLDLSLGNPIPQNVDVLLVVQPTNLHPRAAYAIDQFVQTGGHTLLLLDGAVVDMGGRAVYPIPTGLESVLEAWGVELDQGFIWDRAAYNAIDVKATETEPARVVEYPFWPQILKERLSGELPVTASLSSVNLFWAQELSPRAVEGLASEDLLWTSDEAWSLPFSEPGVYEMEALAKIKDRVDLAGAKRRALAISLSGRFPSPFVGAVPGPINPIKLALHEGRVQRALAAGQEAPALEVVLTDELARSAEADSHVVLVGDADWAGERYFGPANRLFFANLIDWLALEDDLLALRSRMPIERPIADFLAEERAAIGLVGDPEDVDEFEQITIAKYENIAAELAAKRRWMLMAKTTGGALFLALLLGLLWRFSFGRDPSGGKA